jgi:hypothetical protein
MNWIRNARRTWKVEEDIQVPWYILVTYPSYSWSWIESWRPCVPVFLGPLLSSAAKETWQEEIHKVLHTCIPSFLLPILPFPAIPPGDQRMPLHLLGNLSTRVHRRKIGYICRTGGHRIFGWFLLGWRRIVLFRAEGRCLKKEALIYLGNWKGLACVKEGKKTGNSSLTTSNFEGLHCMIGLLRLNRLASCSRNWS